MDMFLARCLGLVLRWKKTVWRKRYWLIPLLCDSYKTFLFFTMKF